MWYGSAPQYAVIEGYFASGPPEELPIPASNPTVLVVDDVPINLRLIDLVLRRDGFNVYTAPDGEQALAVLERLRPNVILVDLQLPGMDGFELTRRIKQFPDLCSAPVLALTASAVEESAAKAYKAGCDGYITKPIDTATLGQTLRRHMDKGSTPPAPVAPVAAAAAPASSLLPLSNPEMESIRRRFLEEGLPQVGQFLEAIGSRFDVQQARLVVHRWIGTAGSIGYPRISAAAQRVQKVLEVDSPDLIALRTEVNALVREFVQPGEAKRDSLPYSVVGVLEGKWVSLVGFAPDEAERLCAALESVLARPRTFAASERADSTSVWESSVVMVQARRETLASAWVSPAVGECSKPLVIAGTRESILAVDARARSRASDFLIDGWQPEEALMRLAFVLSREQPVGAGPKLETAPVKAPAASGPPEVVIADDDALVRSTVRLALADYGMNYHLAATGDEALELIRKQRPQAAVLDVNMPGMDGYLVLAAIRQENLPVKVILLTARNHENDIARAFTLGADDYVVKPFNRVELVARLRRLLKPR